MRSEVSSEYSGHRRREPCRRSRYRRGGGGVSERGKTACALQTLEAVGSSFLCLGLLGTDGEDVGAKCRDRVVKQMLVQAWEYGETVARLDME